MANLNLNKVVLAGRIAGDIELKQTATGTSVVSFPLAVNRPRRADDNSNQPTADFITVVAWRQRAEFISRYFQKGSSICITGSIQTRKWTDQQGQNRYSTEVIVDDAMFVDSKNNQEQPSNAEQQTQETIMVNVDDEDLPF